MGKVLNITNFYRLLEWIMWIAFINLLWIGGTLLGLIVFGVFPATVAMFTVIRQLIIQDTTGKQLFKTYVITYKSEFIKSNVIGIIMTAIGYLLYLDFLFIQNLTGASYYVFYTGLLFVAIIYLVALLYIIPVYVHFELKLLQYFKHAVLIGIASPFMTTVIVIGLMLLYFLLITIPGLIPLITASSVALILMSCTLIVFKKLENKQRENETTM